MTRIKNSRSPVAACRTGRNGRRDSRALLISVGVLGAAQIILVFGLLGGTGIWAPAGPAMKATRVLLFVALFGSVLSTLARRRDATPPD